MSCTFCFPAFFPPYLLSFFFFNDTATTEIYTLSLHDALPIYAGPPLIGHQEHSGFGAARGKLHCRHGPVVVHAQPPARDRSEEHTSELQSRLHLVCRLLLEKKKTSNKNATEGHAICILQLEPH